MTELRLRPRAESDLVERTQFLSGEGGSVLGERFFESAMESLRGIGDNPLAGSLRIGEMCDVPGLRSSRVVGFRCGWFYFARTEHVDVVRLLSYSQDLQSEFVGGEM